MAYATIPNSILNRTPSPTVPGDSHTPLSATFEHLTSSLFSDQSQIHSRLGVSNVLKSLTSSQHSANSYELVEEDDYEQLQVTPRVERTTMETMSTTVEDDSDLAVPVRTTSINRNLPLHNPTPDLQSLQGAYLKNVERLESSAERLSMAGSIEDEVKRMRFDLHRKGSGHSQQSISSVRKRQLSGHSNSITAGNNEVTAVGYTTAGHMASPASSVRSRKRSSQKDTLSPGQSDFPSTLPEPEFEGRPLESAMVHSPPSHAIQSRVSSDSQKSTSTRSLNDDRPGTSASNDTYRQAQHLFTDFDGTHFAYHDDSRSRRISLNQPPLARDSRAFKEPQPGEKMVYYPAPVPVMLNLPKRLSRGDWAVKEKRRTQALSQIPTEFRKSAAWLGNVDDEAELDTSPNRYSNLPAQLRASAFFDAPGVRTDVKLKEGSAVRTLDSILDAAAHAPVSAFTDHPIAGHLGSEVYGPELKQKKKSSEIEKRRKSSLSNILSTRKSSDNLSSHRRLSRVFDNELEMAEDDTERIAEKSIAPGEDEIVDGGDDEKGADEESSEEEEEEHQLGFLGAPTTLLAELQMRKAQQKLRNKTAADAFPDGMHSTLLELDAVAQLQQKSRKMKHVALAWEDHEAVDRTNNEDEDVPLAVLFPEKNQTSLANMHRPIGLLERREIEENEPLGQRRARLRGEVYQPRPTTPNTNIGADDSAPMLKIDGVDEDEDEVEGETLAQRIKRMKEKKENKSSSLADDIASQLGLDPEQIGGTKTPEVEEEEETLGQRRKRLQAEAEKAKAEGNGVLKPKISMGDLLMTNPVGPRNGEWQAAAPKISALTGKLEPGASLVEHIQAIQPGGKAINPPGLRQNSVQYPSTQAMPSYGQHFGQPRLGQQTQFPPPTMGQMNPFMQSTASMPYFPQYPQTHMTMPGMQSMPHLNPMQMHNGQYQQFQYPPGNQFMNMSNMSLGMNNMMNTNPNYPQTHISYMPGHGARLAYDPIAMGPPLDSQQRATIDQWRQDIA